MTCRGSKVVVVQKQAQLQQICR